MKNKAVFLDRDGTINVDHGYVYKIEDFEFLPGVIDALRILQDKGYLLIIITNQSGIARGYYTEEDYHKLTSHMLDALKKEGINIADVFYCPHLPDAAIKEYRKTCDCRKPKTGMFQQAIKKWNIDLSQSYAIGDKARDCEICKGTKCKGFIVQANGGPEKTDGEQDVCDEIRKVETVLQATKIILEVTHAAE